jgi:hypothetical protein
MSHASVDRGPLEQLRIDVAVIKDKLPLLERINDSLSNLRENCRARHEELNRNHHDHLRKQESRILALESAHNTAQAIFESRTSWKAGRKALFWPAVMAVAASAQVLTTMLLYVLSNL